MADVLQRLARVLQDRRGADPGESYAAALYAGGDEAILAKIREEAGELIEAARSAGPDATVHEAADLWFHTLVLLVHKGLGPDQVLAELDRRFGRSGLDEKAARLRE